jgi:hypothetical protein
MGGGLVLLPFVLNYHIWVHFTSGQRFHFTEKFSLSNDDDQLSTIS